jgi:sialidase-1
MKIIGTEVYRRIATPDSVRNSEGAFICLKDGRIMHAYSHYDTKSVPGEDWTASDIAACYSDDGGKTWYGEEILLTMEEEGLDRSTSHTGQNLMSVSLLRMKNMDLGMIYLRYLRYDHPEMYFRRSGDEGKTFSEPIHVTVPGLRTNTMHCAALNSVARYLSCGRIILPTYCSVGGQCLAILFASDDDGHTWREIRSKCSIGISKSHSGLEEPNIIELPNGTLWMFARTDMSRQYEMFSMDNGDTWTNAQPSYEFTSPTSPMAAANMPIKGGIVAVWNPVPFFYDTARRAESHTSEFTAKRNPLAIAVSRDGAKTWCEFEDGGSFTMLKVIYNTDREGGGAAYPSVFCTDDAVLVGYFTYEPHGLDLVIKRITYDELFENVCAGVDNANKFWREFYLKKGIDLKI